MPAAAAQANESRRLTLTPAPSRGATRAPALQIEDIFAAAFRALKPRTPLPRLAVRFRPYANVDCNARLRDGWLEVRLSDLLQGAPSQVLDALARILLGKLYRLSIPPRYHSRYRRFLNRRALRRQADLIRQVRGRKRLGSPEGRAYHLEAIFQQLNQRYFNGLLGMPTLGWSDSRSRNMLGHFDPAHNAIVISRIFDSPHVPRYVIEYLVYHEMLHLQHPVEYCGGRRRVHSARFRRAEQKFAEYDQARRALKTLLEN